MSDYVHELMGAQMNVRLREYVCCIYVWVVVTVQEQNGEGDARLARGSHAPT